MTVEHRYRNLTREEQIRCILRLLELLARSGETRKQQQKGRRGV